eukprot:1342461-Rhodomonas_salina.1
MGLLEGALQTLQRLVDSELGVKAVVAAGGVEAMEGFVSLQSREGAQVSLQSREGASSRSAAALRSERLCVGALHVLRGMTITAQGRAAVAQAAVPWETIAAQALGAPALLAAFVPLVSSLEATGSQTRLISRSPELLGGG